MLLLSKDTRNWSTRLYRRDRESVGATREGLPSVQFRHHLRLRHRREVVNVKAACRKYRPDVQRYQLVVEVGSN